MQKVENIKANPAVTDGKINLDYCNLTKDNLIAIEPLLKDVTFFIDSGIAKHSQYPNGRKYIELSYAGIKIKLENGMLLKNYDAKLNYWFETVAAHIKKAKLDKEFRSNIFLFWNNIKMDLLNWQALNKNGQYWQLKIDPNSIDINEEKQYNIDLYFKSYEKEKYKECISDSARLTLKISNNNIISSSLDLEGPAHYHAIFQGLNDERLKFMEYKLEYLKMLQQNKKDLMTYIQNNYLNNFDSIVKSLKE